MWLALPAPKYRTPDVRMAFYDQLAERLSHVVGTMASTFTTALPLQASSTRQLRIERVPDEKNLPEVWTVAVDRGYFKTLGLPVLQGRAFTDADGRPGSETAVVNARFARALRAADDSAGEGPA